MAPYLTPNIIRQAMAAITGDTMAGMASSAVMIGPPADPTRVEEEGEPEADSSSSGERRHDDDRGVPHGVHEARVPEQRLHVVGPADELVAGADRKSKFLNERQNE